MKIWIPISNAFIRALAAVALVGCIFATGCTPSVKEIRAEGIRQYRGQQYIESMATFRHALGQSPNDAMCNYYMGLNYRAMAARKFRDNDLTSARRELDTAIIYFTQAIKSWPNYMAAVQAQDEALESRGKYDQALAVAERVASNNRGIAEHYVYLGNEYRDHGDYDSALKAYKTALSTEPNNSKAYAGMGKLYLKIGNQDMASDAFRRANEINPHEPVMSEAAASPPAPAAPKESHEPPSQ